MNSSIADIISNQLMQEVRGKGLGGTKESEAAAGDPISDFAQRLAALSLPSAGADDVSATDTGTSLSAAQVDTLAALMEKAPENLAALLEQDLASLPETSSGAALPWLALEAVQGPMAGDRMTATAAKHPELPIIGAVRAALAARNPVQERGAAEGGFMDAVQPASAQPVGTPDALASGPPGIATPTPDATAGRRNGATNAMPVVDEGLPGASRENAWPSEGDAALGPRAASDLSPTTARDAGDESTELTDLSGAREARVARADLTPGTGMAATAQTAPMPGAGSAAPSAVAQMQAAMGSAQWAGELAEQVIAVTLRGDQQVALHLNPRELGPLVVELAMVNNQAQLQFVSSQQAVRAAVEAALPDLREQFAEQGIELGNADVSEDSQPETFGERQEPSGTGRTERDAPLPSAVDATSNPAPDLRVAAESGRVNLYV